MALQSAVRGRYVANPSMMSGLYQSALEALSSKAVSTQHTSVNCFVTDKGISVSTATDVKTGVFIQLVKVGEKITLTTGQKWTIESMVEGTSQTNNVFY